MRAVLDGRSGRREHRGRAGTTGARRCGPIEAQAERIAAARAAADAEGVALFINARVDTYLTGAGEPEERLEETWSGPRPTSRPELTGSSYPGPSTR